MGKIIQFIIILFATFLFSSELSASLQAKELQRLSERAKAVTIIRDDYGVPHIYGKTDADAVFGLLFAQAEDDFNRIERNYIWATGRLAEVEGKQAIFSDLRARLYMTESEAKAAYQRSPQWLRELCDAFADGLNYYLATHPKVKPKLLTRFEPWMPMFFSEGSIGGDIEQIPLKGIAEFYGDQQAPLESLTTKPKRPSYKEPQGSNGFAISGKLTESGNAMLLINPHTSFFFRGEVHVVSEQGLNAYGAVTWGQFFVYQGFNENTGWMHTSTYADFKDEFVEKVSKQGKDLVYQYGDEERQVKQSKIKLFYRSGSELKQRVFNAFHTHHGPITHQLDGHWVATKINWDPVNALQQSFIRTKLANHDEFREMMNIRTNSSNNTVFADSQGNIAYYHGNFMPKRNPKFDYSKPVDGSNPDTDWQGLHSVDEMITVLNPENGWIQNCNSTPFTAAAEHSPDPGNFPKYMAPDPENFRGLHAVKVLKNQQDITLDKLIEIAYDPHLPAFERLIPGLIKAYKEHSKQYPSLQEPIRLLEQWDFKVRGDSQAMTLAHFYGINYLKKGVIPENLGDSSFISLIEHFSNRSKATERLAIFDETVKQLTEEFGTWKLDWQAVNRYQRIDGRIKQPFNDALPSVGIPLASGRWGALASYGAKRYGDSKKIYGTSGNSFVAVVEFGEKLRAKSLLAGGQSGDPKSPHFSDQVALYKRGQFKEVAYYYQDVIKRAKRQYHPGK